MTTQVALFQYIKDRLPAHISFVHELSELLEISYDSAYRRIRGEKEVSLEELKKICLQYHVSVDLLFALQSGNLIFTNRAIGYDGMTLQHWLEAIYSEIKEIHSYKEKEIIYVAKDIPLFHYFDFPDIAAFKIYFWRKALFPIQESGASDFSFDLPPEIITLGRQLTNYYRTIPTAELWNEETITSILRQIDFCLISGYFKSKEEPLRLFDALENWIQHVQHQAERGFRFHHGTKPEGIANSYKLYYNDVLLGDNTILASTDGHKSVYLTYNIINLLISNNPMFCSQVESSLQLIMQKSTLISGTSAKERNRFFCHLLEKVNVARQRVQNAV